MVDDLIKSVEPPRRDRPLLHSLRIGGAVGGVGFVLPNVVHLFFIESGRQFATEVVHRDGLHGLAPDLGFMAVLAAFGAAAGAVVGAMVWYSLPAAHRSKRHLFLTRGLLGGGLFLLALLLPALVWGGVSGVETAVVGTGRPGFGSALLAAGLVLAVGGLPACLTGFVIGGSVALRIGRR